MKKWIALFALLLPIAAFAAVGPLVNAPTLAITAGGTWQSVFPLNQNRSTLWIENPCVAGSQGIATAESIFIGFGAQPTTTPTTSSSGVFEIASCGSLVMTGPYVSQQAVWVYAATTAHAFQAAQSQ